MELTDKIIDAIQKLAIDHDTSETVVMGWLFNARRSHPTIKAKFAAMVNGG